jgi:hypothetical protein
MGRGGVCAVVLLAVLASPAAAPARHRAPRVVVLSNRADLISGGDSLVAVRPSGARATLNGSDVTSKLEPRRGRLVGLLTGLALGRNDLRAKTDRGETVPCNVRVERGAMDRGWNHKRLYQFGGGTAPGPPPRSHPR